MIYRSSAAGEDEQWAPVADLMAVLMLVFMFIAIIFVRTVVEQKEISQMECNKVYKILDGEFRADFNKPEWDAELHEDLTIRFRNPDVLFAAGSSEISAHFEGILSDFFPRYMAVIKGYEDSDEGDTAVKEIRIEGHSSSEYLTATSADDAYFKNMELSQDRTRKILEYVLGLKKAANYQWARGLITANGLSSSRIITTEAGKEDELLSRRVEFRLLVSSCQEAGVYNSENTN